MAIEFKLFSYEAGFKHARTGLAGGKWIKDKMLTAWPGERAALLWATCHILLPANLALLQSLHGHSKIWKPKTFTSGIEEIATPAADTCETLPYDQEVPVQLGLGVVEIEDCMVSLSPKTFWILDQLFKLKFSFWIFLNHLSSHVVFRIPLWNQHLIQTKLIPLAAVSPQPRLQLLLSLKLRLHHRSLLKPLKIQLCQTLMLICWNRRLCVCVCMLFSQVFHIC